MNFTPVVRTSKSIPKSLLEFSIDRKIDTKLLDFELLSFETLMKKQSFDEYKLIEDPKTLSKDDLLDPSTSIIQEYSIKIMPLKKPNKDQSLKLSIAVNKLKTKAVISILKGSVISSKKGFLRELRDQIWKKKLKAGLFINIFEGSLNSTLKKLSKAAPLDKPLPKDIKFSIALGIEPTPPIDAKLVKIYEQKYKDSISFIEGVDKDELILRYIKPVNGKDGRACDGRYIQVREPRNINLKPVTNDTISHKELEESIEYFANVDGYVEYRDGKFCISKTLKLNGADFKSTGAIETGDDKDISVLIKHSKSASEDAVGSGVNIDVKNLDVDGSIGSNVNISTQKLNVDAQTHRKSKLKVANHANIKLHRGDLVANEAKIDILESGKVTANKSIYIKKMLGGEATAPIVKIDELLSNCTVIASKLIEIKSIGGTNIKLIIDPNSIDSYHKELKELEESIKKTKNIFKTNQENFNNDLKKHLGEADRIKTFKRRILQAKKDGKTPMKQDILRVKIYKKTSDELKKMKNNLDKEELLIKEMESELQKMYESDLHAKIRSKSSYDGHSKVIFINPKNKEQITHIPEGKIGTISLTLNSEGERVIKESVKTTV
jgi:hypothetical protein